MNLYFKERKLKINPSTPIIIVMEVLGEAGVLIDGRYHIESTDDGTVITYLATKIQAEFINITLDKLKDDGFLGG